MGLVNYNEQKAVIQKSNSVIEFLDSYAATMNRIIIDLGSVWEVNADQCYILIAIASCVDIASDIVYDYNTFSVNAMKWLNVLNALEKVVKAVIPGKKLNRKSFQPQVSAPKDWIKIVPSMASGYARQIRAFNNSFETAQVQTAGINAQIDEEILKHSRYSLRHINNRIKRLQQINLNIANALEQIVDNYTEKELQLSNMANGIFVLGEFDGELDSCVEKAYAEERKKANSSTWPVEKTYTIELGEIATLTGSEEILQYMRERNAQISAPRSGGCTYYTCDKLKTLGIGVRQPFGHGKDWYDNLKYGKTLTSESKEKIQVLAYDGDSFWNKLLDEGDASVQQPIYNLVISYKGTADSTASAQQYGHVLFIDAIVDGKVYYSDNYSGVNQPHEINIEQFRRRYSAQHYQQQGVIHFTEK